MTERDGESWENPVLVREVFGEAEDDLTDALVRGPHHPREFARRLFAIETLQLQFNTPSAVPEAEPYSLQWYLDIERQRHSRHGRWIPKLLEFEKHANESLLGLGHGLGTDWVQYARSGANVIVCSPANSQLDLVRRNFELRDLPGRFIQAAPTLLPLESNSIDVVCLSSLYSGIDHPERVVEEVLRVLKPGGKVLAVTPARYDVDWFVRRAFFWNRWLGLERRRDPQRPRMRFSSWQLLSLFGQFGEHRVHKRQLRRSEVPYVWRWIPLPLLARCMGHVLILKAFKPITATRLEDEPLRIAA